MLTACASNKVTTGIDFDSSADFEQYRTLAWKEKASAVVIGDSPVSALTLYRIRSDDATLTATIKIIREN